jgi:serine phosphatase RsbU (regulator of sigma subunit)
MTANDHHALQCMEIWGGNQAINRSANTPGLDIWVYSRPFQQSVDGGDVHYVSLCGGGVITRLILADISGHGASVAELGRSLRDLMRQNINRKSNDKLIQQLNRQFAELAKLRRFATAIVATYLTAGDKLTICNAGHPRPLWYCAEARKWTTIDSKEVSDGLANLPLGVDDATVYPQLTLSLGRGDLLLFYTDALTEAENSEGRQLGEDGLLKLTASFDVTQPAQLAESLNAALSDYRDGCAASDDHSFILLHHNGSSPKRQTIIESLNVYAKVLWLKSV